MILFFGGGDRNHVRTPDEHFSSAGSPATIQHSVTQAWDDFLVSLNFSHILEQPDFTFARPAGDGILLSKLDVLFSNVDGIYEPLFEPVAHCISPPDPSQRVSVSAEESLDHSPVACFWRLSRKGRRCRVRTPGSQEQPSAESVVRRPLPEWLLADPTFKL